MTEMGTKIHTHGHHSQTDKISLLLQEDKSERLLAHTCPGPCLCSVSLHLLRLSRSNHITPFRGALTTLLSPRLDCSELLLLTPTFFLPFRHQTAQKDPGDPQGWAL